MKKYLFTGGLLAALAVAMVLGAQAWITDMQDDVTYKETVLFGNKTWAKDITVDSKIQSVHKNLHWDIRFKIGGAKGKVTDSKANFSLKNMSYRKDYDLYIDEDQFGYSTYTETDGSVDLPGKEPLRSMVNAVAAKTEPEKTGTEVLQLSDYCSTLPLNIFYSGNNLSSYVNQDLSAEKYFSIPVSDDYQVTVSVTKNRKGKLKGYSISDYSACVENVSATAKEGCYVAFTTINPREKSEATELQKIIFPFPKR